VERGFWRSGLEMGWHGALSMGMNDTKSSKGERLQWKVENCDSSFMLFG